MDDYSAFTPAATSDDYSAFKPTAPTKKKTAADPYDRPTTFAVPKGGIRMGLAGSGRGSEAQDLPPEKMQVGPIVHQGESTTIPGKLSRNREDLETSASKLKGWRKAAAQAGIGIVKTMGFGSQPTPEDVIAKITGGLTGGLGPLANTALGEAFMTPQAIQHAREGDWEAVATDIGIGAAPGILHGAGKAITKARTTAPPDIISRGIPEATTPQTTSSAAPEPAPTSRVGRGSLASADEPNRQMVYDGAEPQHQVPEPTGDTVTVYRAAPLSQTKLKPGDYVTPSRTYAEEHLTRNASGKSVENQTTQQQGGHILSAEIPKSDLALTGGFSELYYRPSDPATAQAAQAPHSVAEPQAGGALPVFHEDAPPGLQDMVESSGSPAPRGETGKGTGRFHKVYETVSKKLGDLVRSAAAAPETAMVEHRASINAIKQGLSPEKQDLLGRYLVSKRLEGVNPNHDQVLDPTEMAAIAADPDIAAAIERHKTEWNNITQMRLQTGLDPADAAAKDPEFISLVKPDTIAGRARPGGTTAQRLRKATTRFAQQATGQADEYSTDLDHIYRTAYAEVVQKARINEIYKEAASSGLTSPDYVEGWKPEEIYQRPVKDASGEVVTDPSGRPVMTKMIRYMPAELVDALHDVRLGYKPAQGKLGPIARGYQKISTSLALTLNPLELANHVKRIGEAFSNLPPADRSKPVRVMEAMVPYIGPKVGAAIRLIGTNMKDPVNMQIYRDLTRVGGGSARGMQGQYATLPGKLGKVQNWAHEFLFGNMEKGTVGFDGKVRVAAEKIRRAYEGNEDPQRMADFANQFGEYASRMEGTIEAFKKINPYAATNLRLRMTEMRQATGGSGLKSGSLGDAAKLRGETFMRHVGGLFVGAVLLNKAMSGKYPWENDEGHEFQIDTGRNDTDGQRVYMDFRALSPMFGRVANTFGLRQVAREVSKGGNWGDIASAEAVGNFNQLLNIINSPGLNEGMIAATGEVPYFSKRPGQRPNLLDVAKHEPSENKMVQNLMAAGRQANPFAGVVMPGPDAEVYAMESPWARFWNMAVAGSLKK